MTVTAGHCPAGSAEIASGREPVTRANLPGWPFPVRLVSSENTLGRHSAPRSGPAHLLRSCANMPDSIASRPSQMRSRESALAALTNAWQRWRRVDAGTASQAEAMLVGALSPSDDHQFRTLGRICGYRGLTGFSLQALDGRDKLMAAGPRRHPRCSPTIAIGDPPSTGRAVWLPPITQPTRRQRQRSLK